MKYDVLSVCQEIFFIFYVADPLTNRYLVKRWISSEDTHGKEGVGREPWLWKYSHFKQ